MYLIIKRATSYLSQWEYITPVRVFLISTMIVNAGNYAYNLLLGRLLTPAEFSEVGIVISLLLMFSFLAMTFQIVATKYTVDLEKELQASFKKWINRTSMLVGGMLMVAILIASPAITSFFHLSNNWIIPVFALALPFYFLMSVRRGYLQGREAFGTLSSSYQIEMWSRFGITFLLLLFLTSTPGLLVSIAVVLSVLSGTVVVSGKEKTIASSNELTATWKKTILRFFFITAAYEIAQVIINYSDLFLVKHYFDSSDAGLYTSMSLIGRMIYFITWMVVMILVPRVLKLKQEGLPYQKVFLQYIGVIGFCTLGITTIAYLFPELIVSTFFGSAYLAIAPYLWVYGLATSLFALSNVFVYYFLSLDQYVPVYVAITLGVVQVVLLTFLHETMEQMIWVQVANLSVLLGIQAAFYIGKNLRQ